MGVWCIVFDIDGMLFEFCMNFFNIEKYKIKKKKSIFFFKISCFLRVSCYFQHLKKKNLSKKFRGGGGGLKKIFFFRKQFFLISRFILFSALKKKLY